MKRIFPVVTWTILIAFSALSIWSWTARGLLETPSLDVPHFDAGAGDLWLIVRAGLAVIGTLLLAISACLAGTLRSRIAYAVTALLLVPIFVTSVRSVERRAIGYSDAAFADLYQRYSAREPLTENQVIAALGYPLFTTRAADGSAIWSYTFTPSSGFGWHKRIIHWRGNTVGELRFMDEP